MIFANPTAAAVWKENHCDRCFEPAQTEQRLTGRGRGCMILSAAMTRVTPPVQIVKGRSGAMMADAFKCSSFAAKPTSTRPKAPVGDVDDPSLFGDLFFDTPFVDAGDHA